jgi:endonuclease/exonuclease/phosphatase family metal-dependent hydrolase
VGLFQSWKQQLEEVRFYEWDKGMIYFTSGFSGLLVLFGLLLATSPLAGAEDDQPLRVMTYNLRYASDTPPHAWPQRLPVAVAMLGTVKPDVIGMQEALWRQVRDLEEALPAYGWIGLGRDGGSQGEFMAIFFLKARLEPLVFDHFWLSDKPNEIGSTSWGNSNRRMVTWVLLRDKKTNRRFYFWNTHFDHEVQLAREKSAALVLKRVALLPAEVPVVLVGDFNADHAANPVYGMLVNKRALTDTWVSAEKRGKLFGTFHGYKPPRPGASRIDWILTRGSIRTVRTQIVTYQQNGQTPSDHFPVVADLVLAE